MLIDAHNHLQDPRFEGRQDELITSMKNVGVTQCVVNGTCESDWPAVASLAKTYPDFVLPAFGLHPWKVNERSQDWQSQLVHYLEKFPQATVGECGLDRWIKNPNLDAQHEVFRYHLSLGRPVTIHCLQAWGPLMEELRQRDSLPPILLHSFNGSLEIANELIKLGAYFSFSGYFLHSRKATQLEIFRKLPAERILLETDAPDMMPPQNAQHITLGEPLGEWNHPANLSFIASHFYKASGIPLHTLSQNTRRFFQIPHG